MIRKKVGSSQNGFSVVEILVALIVVTMLSVAILGVLSGGTSLNARSSLRAEAGALAFKKIQDYINLSYSNVPIGSAGSSYVVEDFSSEAEAKKLKNAEAKVYVKSASVLPATPTPVTTTYSQTVTGNSTYISGSEIDQSNYNDATGYHYRPQRIADGNYTNYTYNYYSPGPDNKPLPSIDLGSNQLVDNIRVTWYGCGYRANNFRIEAKDSSPNSNSGWTTIVSGLNDGGAPCLTDKTQIIDVSSHTTPHRHWRMYVVDGTDSSWNVISEFEAFSAGTPGDIVEQHGSDASSNPGKLDFSDSTLVMSENGSNGHQSVGMIFDNLNIANGATVTNAYVEFTSEDNQSGAVTLKITGVDLDNAPAWSGNYAVDNAVDSNAADGKTGTTATVTWTPASWSTNEKGTDTRVDVTSILQEIVDRAGWTSNNSVAFAVQNVSGSGHRTAKRTASPELVINWSETVASSSPSAYVDLNGDGEVDNPNLLRVWAIIEYDAFGKRHKVQYETYIRKFGVSD
ncbi:type II secretion system protein [Candidatus Saccharibacteria bacterium]|nr:type II secretion system protein [Candidatus Saccharibacteria bacterium]